MSKTAHHRIATLVVMAGLVSALMCQSHVVAEAAEMRENVAHSQTCHDGVSHSPQEPRDEHEGAPSDLCCLTHAGEIKLVDKVSVVPTAVDIGTAPGIERPSIDPAPPKHILTYKPPGTLSPLHQTCTLLI